MVVMLVMFMVFLGEGWRRQRERQGKQDHRGQ